MRTTMKFVATAAVLATLALGAPAGEARLTRAELPKPCRVDGGDEVFVLACDPDRRADQIHLRVGAAEATPTEEPGVGRLRSDEPLQPGETVSLRWRHPSAHAVLSVRAMAPDRPRRVILDLRGRPASVDVTAQADGSLRVTTPTGRVTVPTPASLDVPWEPRSARAAATQLLGAVDHLEGSLRARATLCASLDPTVLPYYQLLFLDP